LHVFAKIGFITSLIIKFNLTYMNFNVH